MGSSQWLSELKRRLRNLVTPRAQFDRDLEEEMRLHRDLRAREFRETGATPEESRFAAQRKFGNALRLREEIHQAWGWSWIDDLGRDFKYGLRRLRNSPGFTTVAVITLALGIGANTAIFTLIQQVMLSPLPVAHANELYSLGDDKLAWWGGGLQEDFSTYSYGLYRYLHDHTPEFSDLASFSAGTVSLGMRRKGEQNAATSFRGEYVSGNYFIVFGVDARKGRLLMPADGQPNAPPAVVMSYRAWADRFGSDPQLVGSVLVVKGVPVTLVGITPPEFFGDTLSPYPPDLWMPLTMERVLNPGASLLDHWNEHWLYAMGRLRPGAKPGQVQAHVTAELQQWLKENYVADRYSSDPYVAARYTKDIPKQHIVVMPASGGVATTRDNNRDALRLLMVLSALVLVIACANTASLLLARGTASRLQIAVRMALGATRAAILRQTMAEGVLLAVIGGALGLWVSMATARLIVLLAFRDAKYVPIHTNPSLPVLGFACVISLLTGLFFSMEPAWIASRVQPADPMRGTGRSVGDPSAMPQKSMLVLQAAASLVLLVGAGLLTRSLQRLELRSFGLEPQGRLLAWIDVPRNLYPPARLETVYQQLQQRLGEVPGVMSSSFASSNPMAGGMMNEPISIQGKPPVPKLKDGIWPSENRISAHYFQTLGTPLVRGRVLDEHDTAASEHVAVIDEAFAKSFFPGEDPIGMHFGIQTARHSGDYRIVGIVANAQYVDTKIGLYPTFFLPLLQSERYEDSAEDMEQVNTAYANTVQLDVAGRPEAFMEPLRAALARVDPNITVIRMTSLQDQIAANFDQQRLVARLTTLYALLALVLASVGLYGVASYMAARRVNEIGIRMALGADRHSVVALMLRGAMRPVVLGLAVGIPAALAAARVMASQLYGVKSYDPLILASAAAVLSLCALVAAYVPARRSASIDPMQALRSE
ncbi:MAG TPA: ABC transporter permease [Candidatus Angelobacter sp.]